MNGTLTISWSSLRHNCNTPSRVEPSGDVSHVSFQWRCSECGQRWRCRSYYGSATWSQEGAPSRRWRKAEARRIIKENKRKAESS